MRRRWVLVTATLLVLAGNGAALVACGTGPDGGPPAAGPTTPVAPPPRASGTVPAESPPVDRIGWNDRTHTVRCAGISGSPLTVRVSGGSGSAPGDGVETGYEIELGTVAYGDLTGDGRPEAAVPISCAPRDVSPNFYTVELQVFSEGGTLLQAVPSPPAREPSDFGIAPRFAGTPRIAGNLLVDRVDRWVGADPRSSPSVQEPLALTWNGSEFVEAAG